MENAKSIFHSHQLDLLLGEGSAVLPREVILLMRFGVRNDLDRFRSFQKTSKCPPWSICTNIKKVGESYLLVVFVEKDPPLIKANLESTVDQN